MIEINGRWRAFSLENWRLNADSFENYSHADQADRVLNVEWDGERIQGHGSENMTLRLGTEYAAS
jgi:hypothetical protein